jgi:hypothetical protein
MTAIELGEPFSVPGPMIDSEFMSLKELVARLKDSVARLGDDTVGVEVTANEINVLVGNAGASLPTNSPGIGIHKHYQIFREYVEHEDALVNNRVLWNINIQGFLFAAYGFSVQALAQDFLNFGRKMSAVEPLIILVVMLPIVGISVSYFSLKGVKAAQKAISDLKAQWDEVVKKLYAASDPDLLPCLIGGGKPSEPSTVQKHNWGFLAPKGIPIICIIVWGTLLLTFFAICVYSHFFKV